MAEKKAIPTEEEVDKMNFGEVIWLLQEDDITKDDMDKLTNVEALRAELKRRIREAQESKKHPGQAAEKLSKIKDTQNTKRERLAELCYKITAYLPKLDERVKNKLEIQFGREVGDILKDVQSHLDKDECHILVAGETSAGKSTFLNLLLGEDILPVAHLSSTSTICEVKYGETRQAVVHLRQPNEQGQRQITISLDGTKEHKQELESYTHLEGASRESDDLPPVERVEIFLPLSFLQGGIVIVDSPGVGESKVMDKVVADYIPKVFAFLYIIDSSKAGGVQQDRLGRLLQLYAKKDSSDNSKDFNPESAMFICNKWDTVSLEEQDKVKTETLRKLSEMWPGLEESQVFYVSTKKAVRRFGDLSEDFIEVLKGLDLLLPKSLDIKLETQYRLLTDILSAALTHIDSLLNIARQNLDKEAKVERYQEAQQHLNSFQKEVNSSMDSLNSIINKNMQDTLSSLQKTGKLKNDIILNTSTINLKRLGLWHSNTLAKLKNEKKESKNENFSKLKDLYGALADDLAHCPSFEDRITSIESRFEQEMKEGVESLVSAYQNAINVCGHAHAIMRQMDVHDVLFNRPSPYERFVAFLKGVSLSSLSSRLGRFEKRNVQAVWESQSKTRLEVSLCSYWVRAPKGTPLVDILISALSSSEELITDLAERQMQPQRDLMALLEDDITKMRTTMEQTIDQTFKGARGNDEILQTYEPQSRDINNFLGQLAMFHLTSTRRYEYDLDKIKGWTDTRNRIGHGTFAEVFQVKVPHKGAQAPAALKIGIYPFGIISHDTAWEFLKEEDNLWKLKGDHIVEYYGTACRREADGLRLGLVMELCEGNLADRIINKSDHNPAWWGSNPEKQAAAFSYTQNLAVQLCEGLMTIHDAGYIHRDLKLSNILVTKDNVVKLADVGQTKREVDITGTKAGTPLYAAPEVKARKVYDKSADIYSLGLILLEMWYGRTLYGMREKDTAYAKQMKEALKKGKDIRMPRWRGLVTPIQAWIRLMHKCLKMDPKKRPKIQYCLNKISVMKVKQSKKHSGFSKHGNKGAAAS